MEEVVEGVGSGVIQLLPASTVGHRTTREAPTGGGLMCAPHHTPQLLVLLSSPGSEVCPGFP